MISFVFARERLSAKNNTIKSQLTIAKPRRGRNTAAEEESALEAEEYTGQMNDMARATMGNTICQGFAFAFDLKFMIDVSFYKREKPLSL
jgi:hypothetical protein